MSLIYALLAALTRCRRRVGGCVASCVQDLAATIRGYFRDRALGKLDTSYSGFQRPGQGRYGDAIEHVPSGYTAITALLQHVRLNEADVFVDLGCGKGRVLFAVAQNCALKKVIGVELDEKLVGIARSNVAKFVTVTGCTIPIEICHLDATVFSPKEGTVFYMFHPFEYKTMLHVLCNIRISLTEHPREIRILYNNPKQAMVLAMQDWLIEEGELEKSGVYVWRSKTDVQQYSSSKRTGARECV